MLFYIKLLLSNLTKEQRQGLNELKEMKGVVITETDKSKKLVAIDEKMYDDKMDEFKRDKKITREEAKKMEAVSRGHMKSMLRNFKMGESGNKQVERIEASLCTSKSSGANLKGLLKDYKEDMPFRPVSDCTESHSSPLSEVVTMILDNVLTDKNMMRSTEEVLKCFRDYNNEVRKNNPKDATDESVKNMGEWQ